MTPDLWLKNGRKRPIWTDGSFAPYALDNGAWGAFNSGKPFDDELFMRAYASLVGFADFVCIPDVVGDRESSLKKTESYLSRLPDCRKLVVVQDGMVESDIEPWLGEACGIAVGGTTDWKLSSLPMWSRLSKKVSCHLHVLRVNTKRRIWLAQGNGAHSIDGTSVSLFPKSLDRLQRALSQRDLFGGVS